MTGEQECNSAIARGRLGKAIEFIEAAELLESDSPNAASDLFVDAGIAAADVICCAALGKHSSSSSHNDAVNLLARADPESAKDLSALLGLKNKVSYTHRSLSPDEHKRASRAAGRLVEAAKRAAAGIR